jgi:hypothetical protein
MHILVLGGTGAIGLLLIRELLASQANHTLVVYARSPNKLPDDLTSHDRVKVAKGELMDRDAMSAALEGIHAVVSTLGPAVSKGPFHPPGTPLAKGYKLLIELMQERNITRLIALGTASNKDPNDKSSIKFWTLVTGVATFAHHAYEDVVAIGETIRGTEGLIYTLGRVPILTSGEKEQDRKYVAGYIGDGKTGVWLPRLAYAVFVTEELEKNEWVRKSPLVSGA